MMSDIEASNNSKAHTGLEEEEIEEVEPKDGAQSAKIGISSKGGEETAGDGNRVIDLTDFHQLSYIGVFLSAMVLVIALTIKEDDVTFTESEKWFKVAEYGEYGLGKSINRRLRKFHSSLTAHVLMFLHNMYDTKHSCGCHRHDMESHWMGHCAL